MKKKISQEFQMVFHVKFGSDFPISKEQLVTWIRGNLEILVEDYGLGPQENGSIGIVWLDVTTVVET